MSPSHSVGKLQDLDKLASTRRGGRGSAQGFLLYYEPCLNVSDLQFSRYLALDADLYLNSLQKFTR